MQTTKEIVTWLVDELTKAVESQVMERLRQAVVTVGVAAERPEKKKPGGGGKHVRGHVSPGTAEALITTRRTWTPAQLRRAGGAANDKAAGQSLGRLAAMGKLRRIKRGLYEVTDGKPGTNGVQTAA